MFEAILDDRNASRATAVANKLAGYGFSIALTGGLAIETRLRALGDPVVRRPLNDLDFVVENLATIPEALMSNFLVHHVHPFAPEGKTLLQLVDRERAVRVDLFRAFGNTLLRRSRVGESAGSLDVVAIEDLAARATAHVCAALGRGRRLETKHADAFRRLSGVGQRDVLEEAWRDHREDLPMSFDEAKRQASRLLERHPKLLVDEEYSTVVRPCARCQTYGAFRPTAPESIVRILGYW